MTYLDCLIPGVPYGKHKRRGKIEAPAKWTQILIEKTSELPKVKEASALNITFLFPPDKYPLDLPYGPDLDNFLKRLMDALKHTIFSDAKGHDSCVIILYVWHGGEDNQGFQKASTLLRMPQDRLFDDPPGFSPSESNPGRRPIVDHLKMDSESDSRLSLFQIGLL